MSEQKLSDFDQQFEQVCAEYKRNQDKEYEDFVNSKQQTFKILNELSSRLLTSLVAGGGNPTYIRDDSYSWYGRNRDQLISLLKLNYPNSKFVFEDTCDHCGENCANPQLLCTVDKKDFNIPKYLEEEFLKKKQELKEKLLRKKQVLEHMQNNFTKECFAIQQEISDYENQMRNL